MKKLSKTFFINQLLVVLLLTAIAKMIGVIALWFLPHSTQEIAENEKIIMPYHRIDFHNMIQPLHVKQDGEETITQNKLNINSLLLSGLYGKGNSGYAIVAKKSAPKNTEIISVGQLYQGYKLSKIFLNHVVFIKNKKEYILHLQNNSQKKLQEQFQNTVINTTNNIKVTRTDIEKYSKNMAQIWRDISIQELGKNGNLKGFKVTKIRPNSKMARLGLQKGDIIIKANGVRLQSYTDVLKIYQDLYNLNEISLVIKRGNTKKEIYYEIN